MSTRPPHLETPFSVFNDGPITANDAFFVRYHLANFPLAVDLATFRLTVKGLVDRPLSLSLAELKALAEPVEVVAVNQWTAEMTKMQHIYGAPIDNHEISCLAFTWRRPTVTPRASARRTWH